MQRYRDCSGHKICDSLQCSYTSSPELSATDLRHVYHTCHIAISYSCWRHSYFVDVTKAQCESQPSPSPFNCTLAILLLTFLLTCYILSKWTDVRWNFVQFSRIRTRTTRHHRGPRVVEVAEEGQVVARLHARNASWWKIRSWTVTTTLSLSIPSSSAKGQCPSSGDSLPDTTE